MLVPANNKFLFLSYLFGKKKKNPTFLIQNEHDFSKDYSIADTKVQNHLALGIKGYIYLGERNLFTQKKSIICLYLSEEEIFLEIRQIEKENSSMISTTLLFQFFLNPSNYKLTTTHFIICDKFEIYNLSTQRVEFSNYYWHPYNRTLFYDGTFEDMIFKEISQEYNTKEWQTEIKNRLKNQV